MSIEKTDKLKEALLLCSIHHNRMSFAYSKINTCFPLSHESYSKLMQEDYSFFDQLIFRFSKLQDAMGEKLFPAVLENLGEETKGKPFIDLLNKMEELTLLDNSNNWLLLRETRNVVIHEYPFITEEVIDGLNLLNEHYFLINAILEKLRVYCSTRFKL